MQPRQPQQRVRHRVPLVKNRSPAIRRQPLGLCCHQADKTPNNPRCRCQKEKKSAVRIERSDDTLLQQTHLVYRHQIFRMVDVAPGSKNLDQQVLKCLEATPVVFAPEQEEGGVFQQVKTGAWSRPKLPPWPGGRLAYLGLKIPVSKETCRISATCGRLPS